MQTTFPKVFNTACQQAAATDPNWHLEFETADLPSCTPAQLHDLASKAPNPYLSGFLAGQALSIAGRG